MVESQEYRTLKRYIPEVGTAVKSNLTSLSGRLLSRNLISPENDAKLRNQSMSEEDRAAELVSLLLVKVKLNRENYRIFIDVLRTSGEHYNDLLSKLEPPEAQEIGSLHVSIDSQQTTLQASAGAISDSKVPVGALGMTCGCGICTSELGCPNPLPSEIKFPLSDKCFGSLNDREKQDFLFELRRDTIQIMKQFYRLASELYNSINHSSRLVTVRDLRANLYEIKAYPNEWSEESIFHEYEKKLENATDIEQIFNIITKICSFLDYDLLEHLTNKFGEEEDKKRMNKYCEDFAKYARRRTSIYECPYIESADSTKWSDVYVKLDSRLEAKLTIEQLREFRYKIGEILSIHTSAIHFCCAQSGCIELKLQLPNFIKKVVVPLSFEEKIQLKQLGVIQFSTDDYKWHIKEMDHLDGEKAFHKWCELLQGRSVTLVTAGQSGVGKSTLVKNLLRLTDEDADTSVARHSAERVTNEVKCHNSQIKGTNITIIDTPGLTGASENDEFKILAQLSEKTNRKADILLYCISMAPSSRVGEVDHRIIKLLTMAFTPRIWERTILVLTSADNVKKMNKGNARNPTVEKGMKHYAEKFETILQTTLSDHNVTVIPVLQDEGIEIRPAKQIAAVPAGQTCDEEILPHKKWNVSIYEEVLRKCKIDAIPAFLSILDVFTRQMYMVTGSVAIAGIALGALVLGLATGGIGPALVGGAIGGLTGAALGTAISKRFYGISYNRFIRSTEVKPALTYI